MSIHPKYAEIMSKYEKMQNARSNFEARWRDCVALVRTGTLDPQGGNTPGEEKTLNIYDGTAPWALEQLAAGLSSYLTSPTDRWLAIYTFDEMDQTDEILAWLEHVTDTIYREYSDPQVNLYPMLNECYMDLGGLGTTVLYQDYNWDMGHTYFKSFPLADCYIAENAMGRVDTNFRKCTMSVRQIKQEFTRSGDQIPAKIESADDAQKFTIVHAVYPRTDKSNYKSYAPKGMPFASCWVVKELKDVPPIRESGFSEFPYHVPRWTKLAGEIYGRCPAMGSMPDIKMVNQMSKITLIAGQKAMDPPLVVPNDGFILPLATDPGSIIFKEPGDSKIEALPTGEMRFDIGLEMMNQRRDAIMKAFYVDYLLRQKKKERQTLGEIQDDRNEMLRQMAPMLGRTSVELLSPMIQRTYSNLQKAGRIRPAPEALHGKRLRVGFVSPAALAQYGGKATNLQAFLQDVQQYASIHPEILDIIDTDQLAQELAKYRDISRKVINSPEKIAAIRQQRQQSQQLAAAAKTAKDAGSAASSFADAAQTQQETQAP